MPTAALDERRRAEAVMEAVRRCESLGEFMPVTLAALDEHLGLANGAFMLSLAGMPRAYAGQKHGTPEYVMEEYFERWVDVDPLGSPTAQAQFDGAGWTSTASIYSSLDSPRRRFVDDFLRRTRSREELSVRLPGPWSNGYLTVMGPEPPAPATRRAFMELAPALTEELQARLPRGLDGCLSTREAQVAELVALGFRNRNIGDVLHVEEDTVKKHVSRAIAALGLRHRTELAVAWATGAPYRLSGITDTS